MKMPSGSFMIKMPGLGPSIVKSFSQDEKKIMAQDFFDVEKSKDVIAWVSKQGKEVNLEVYCKSFANSWK